MITLYGSTPSKKNSRINTRSGRSFPSSKYTAWHKDASLQLKGIKPFTTTSLCISFIVGDKRKFDLTNKAESIMDLLVDNGIIEDDNYSVIPELTLKYGGYEKGNPHCIIEWK
jgi:Holliday junction resolvase RusA-like endonuclease